MVTIGILQPGYLPWLGFFEQMHRSDVFVIYDDVQYDKHSWRNRNRIKTANGVQWLTVPVMADIKNNLTIRETLIDNKTNWRKKHLQSISQSYSKAPFFKNYLPIFEEAFLSEWKMLFDIDIYFIRRLANAMGIDSGKMVLSSSLNVAGDKLSRLVNICKKLNADVFYEGAAGRDYINAEYFSENGVKVVFQDYKHPEYKQLHGEFQPYLSVIDLLFNHGGESLNILTAN